MLLNAIQSFLTYCEISLFFITRKFVFFYICCAAFQDLLLPLVYGTVLSFFFFFFFLFHFPSSFKLLVIFVPLSFYFFTFTFFYILSAS